MDDFYQANTPPANGLIHMHDLFLINSIYGSYIAENPSTNSKSCVVFPKRLLGSLNNL